jgi:hypothetical protein
MSRLDIPTEKDWLDWPEDAQRPYELDEAYAREQFAGKSFEEALEMFRSREVLMCSEDVSYMPPVPFRYYMLVFKVHVLELGKREIEERDLLDAPWSAAGSFLNLVEAKLQSEINFTAPIVDDLLPAVEFIAMNQERYFADRDIYGDFRDQLTRIKKLWGV